MVAKQVAPQNAQVDFRPAEPSDIDALLNIENACFSADKLSKRSFRHWIQAPHGALLVCTINSHVLAYGLLWCHKGTRLARLYSLAIHPDARGQGIADKMLEQLEFIAVQQRRIFMRLEVSENNAAAIKLYQRNGYTIFGEYCDYYEDHSDALRMQKRILRVSQDTLVKTTPWYPQSTEFTCGPASIMMAMGSLNAQLTLTQQLELEIWREATTIFMTSGHGGCHPIGLALAAHHRGYDAEVYINSNQVLFLDGVRSEKKRGVLEVVHHQFVTQAEKERITLHYQDIDQVLLQQRLREGYAIIILISTYRLDGKKAPHWVCVTAIDEKCIYVHDPDPETENQIPIDCQHLPIDREDFDKMSAFGACRLRTAVMLKPQNQTEE